MKKIKVEDVYTYEKVTAFETEFGSNLLEQLTVVLTNIYGISESDFNSSVLYKLFHEVDIDFDYFIEHSSEKLLSKFALLIIEKSNNDLEVADAELSSHIAYKFAFKWWKLSDAITTNYKPLENYDMEEQKNVATDVNVHQESESGIYGFNSTESNPTATGSGDNHTTGLKAGNEEVLTRHGNIGVTTSQQMLESEIVLREKHNLIDMIFKDIDSVLCLKVY